MTISATTQTQVPLLDLNAQYEPIKDEIFKAFKAVFDSKVFINGPKVTELEKQLADYCQVSHAIGVSSGTDALVLSLMALGVGPGDEVITTPFTFFATAGSIARVGAKPVFVDIDPDTFLMDIDLIESKITPQTKAILPVHLFGQMVNMDKINEIAKQHRLWVIEDAAQAIGASFESVSGVGFAGSFGDVGCFSFFPSKNLGCCGDAGFISTNNAELANRLQIMRVHGGESQYVHRVIGGNFRIDAVQAAILSVKLPYLEQQHSGRIQNASYYNGALQSVSGVQTPIVKTPGRMIYNQYTIRTKHRDQLKQFLSARQIGNAIYYPLPLHMQECFAYLGYQEGDFPNTELAAKEVLSIPIYSELSESQKLAVTDAIRGFSPA